MRHLSHVRVISTNQQRAPDRAAISNDLPERVNRRTEASGQDPRNDRHELPQTCRFRYAAESAELERSRGVIVASMRAIDAELGRTSAGELLVVVVSALLPDLGNMTVPRARPRRGPRT